MAHRAEPVAKPEIGQGGGAVIDCDFAMTPTVADRKTILLRHTYSVCKNCVRHKAAMRLTSRVL